MSSEFFILEQMFADRMRMQSFLIVWRIVRVKEMHLDPTRELYCSVSSPLRKVGFFLMY
jgi:hypothetical protein